MSTNYDDKLKELAWFKLHPQLLPFIGRNYDEYKILQIGESHYINRENDKFGICYFRDHWWNESCDDLVAEYGGWFNTRKVVEDCLNGGKSRAYNIFYNTIKSFSEVILKKKISHINLKDKQLYHNFSFMNFYQMPSLHKGLKYWNSLEQSADGNLELASETFKKCVETSVQMVNKVIDILNPKIIIFTSVSAGYQYKGEEYPEYSGKYKNDNRVIYTSHPCSAYWNKSGKYILEEKLRNIKINSS